MEDRLFGSFAERVAWEAEISVLVVRGGDRTGWGWAALAGATPA